MGLDVIPREEGTGEVIDPRTASIVNLYRVVCAAYPYVINIIIIVILMCCRLRNNPVLVLWRV